MENEKTELLVDLFFDRMHHNSAVVYPYYADPEYAHNIANDYMEEHPEFTVPEKDEHDSYKFDKTQLDELKNYCDNRCEYYGYYETDEEE